MPYDPLDPDADCFKPPEQPVEVFCLHCQREYESYLIHWEVSTDVDGKPHGFWRCPTPGCDGAGFGFDILPTDPDYQDEHGGWVHMDDDDDDDAEDWDEEEDWEEDEATPPVESDGPSPPPLPDDDEEIPF